MAPWLRRSGDVELRTAGGALVGLGTAQRTQPQPLALALALALAMTMSLTPTPNPTPSPLRRGAVDVRVAQRLRHHGAPSAWRLTQHHVHPDSEPKRMPEPSPVWVGGAPRRVRARGSIPREE